MASSGQHNTGRKRFESGLPLKNSHRNCSLDHPHHSMAMEGQAQTPSNSFRVSSPALKET
eukprot:CAMPEP_0181509510 /NCGR_PEP_ID=MMETSP1110-20121109/60379_1 /TAXON_ID=174948 /ORGANISM="Symbiodinium sp., Strain CCMP421" /LENGTH=59 /DNA_ID=CAMNT_0023639065 /DNA_START=1 /DNA_END=176 /DNA_ORIENTATION=+